MIKAFITLIFLLQGFIISFAQVNLKRQAYWGASFVARGGENPGGVVRRIIAGGPAGIAGLQNGDVILKANGIVLADEYVFDKTFRSIKANEKVILEVLRNDSLRIVTISPSAKPLEQYKNVEVEYSSVVTEKGHHVRTVLTKPAGRKDKLPVIFLTQWLSCSQVELDLNSMDSSDSLMYDLITKSGFAFMRVEKPGLGDSEGPDCSECDYDSELAIYKAALKQLKQKSFIDTNAIYVFGFSIGAASAPLVFENENIKGMIVTGGFYNTWYEHMLEIERKRLSLLGKTPGEITGMLTKYIEFYNDYLNHKMTPIEIIRRKPHLKNIWYDGNAHQYGRPAVYYQQVQDKNVAASWEKIKCPVLVVYGEYDWIMSRKDHEAIVQALNKNNPGKATLFVVPKMSHGFAVFASEADAFKNRNGRYAQSAANYILEWLKKN